MSIPRASKEGVANPNSLVRIIRFESRFLLTGRSIQFISLDCLESHATQVSQYIQIISAGRTGARAQVHVLCSASQRIFISTPVVLNKLLSFVQSCLWMCTRAGCEAPPIICRTSCEKAGLLNVTSAPQVLLEARSFRLQAHFPVVLLDTDCACDGFSKCQSGHLEMVPRPSRFGIPFEISRWVLQHAGLGIRPKISRRISGNVSWEIGPRPSPFALVAGAFWFAARPT